MFFTRHLPVGLIPVQASVRYPSLPGICTATTNSKTIVRFAPNPPLSRREHNEQHTIGIPTQLQNRQRLNYRQTSPSTRRLRWNQNTTSPTAACCRPRLPDRISQQSIVLGTLDLRGRRNLVQHDPDVLEDIRCRRRSALGLVSSSAGRQAGRHRQAQAGRQAHKQAGRQAVTKTSYCSSSRCDPRSIETKRRQRQKGKGRDKAHTTGRRTKGHAPAKNISLSSDGARLSFFLFTTLISVLDDKIRQDGEKYTYHGRLQQRQKLSPGNGRRVQAFQAALGAISYTDLLLARLAMAQLHQAAHNRSSLAFCHQRGQRFITVDISKWRCLFD